ncbi:MULTISPECIES: hypothetical protein [Fusobacterium]|uniref:Uncharacterized protein n=1 Tax=Fusobacterium nucleatum TaxID=851 RepID=A0A323TZ12_FUSNU|nr:MULTISPECIES: hypothetical protein [Fusobacterium]PCR85147.1 hypothetical protein CQA79_06045 [Fusobacterium nucleatum]PZA05129.1 hypothetical protein DNF10_02320 [Fusobacterium nucleatum]QJX51682.1 hypothetical protein HOO60_12360 [Fusobacterium nucleatum]QYR60170.1 hypothetical protein JY397_06165 [Fusobacterium polymorphum]HCE32598.1 hypothetical protein [Fusobacterium sp.]
MSILDELDIYDEKKNEEPQNLDENDKKNKNKKEEDNNKENSNNESIDFTEDYIERLIKRIIDSSLKDNNTNLEDKIDTLITLTKETNSKIQNLSFKNINKELETTEKTIEEIRETVYDQLLNYQKNVTDTVAERFKIMLENLIEVTSKLREINIILNENLSIDNFINKISENKKNKKSNFIIYTVILLFGLLGLVIFKLKMR